MKFLLIYAIAGFLSGCLISFFSLASIRLGEEKGKEMGDDTFFGVMLVVLGATLLWPVGLPTVGSLSLVCFLVALFEKNKEDKDEAK